jgi:hypothetical protein
MSFPAPSITPPTLANYQMSYLGLTFGGIAQGATYQLQSLPSGLDMPPVMAADVQRAMDHGEFDGLDLSAGRDVTVTQLVTGATAVALDQARQALGGVMAVAGNTNSPLYIQLPSGLFACMARPRKHGYKLDINSILPFNVGTPGGDAMTSVLHATDPRWYAMPTKASAPVGLTNIGTGGLTFPAQANFSFGGGGSVGLVTVYNNGLFEMRPVLLITGPCTNPVATNLSLPGAPSVGFDLTMNAGDTLTVNTDFESAVYTTAGTTTGASRQNTEAAGSTWFNLPPGPNLIQFSSSDTTAVAGTMVVQSGDAWMAI